MTRNFDSGPGFNPTEQPPLDTGLLSEELRISREYHELKQKAKEVAQQLNNEITQKFGEQHHPLLGENGRLQKTWFGSKTENAFEINEVQNRQIDYLDVDTDDEKEIIQLFQQRYGTNVVKDIEDVLDIWKKKHKTRKGTQAEIAYFVLLNNLLADEYYVYRTTDFDDMCNKSDLIIIDKETGQPLMALDVYQDGRPSYMSQTPDRASESKLQTISRIQNRGGQKIRYGISMDKTETGNKLHPQVIHHLPLFMTILDAASLKGILESFKSGATENTELEQEVLQTNLNFIQQQLGSIQNTTNKEYNERIQKVKAFIKKQRN